MSPTRDRLLALLKSGALAHAAQGKTSQAHLARSLGVTPMAYERAIARIRGRGEHFPTLAELQGQHRAADTATEAPIAEALDIDVSDWDGDGHAEPLPAGHFVRGVSTYFDGEGQIRGQWVKTNTTQEQRLEQLIAAMPAIAEDWRGRAEPVEVPQHCEDDLLNVVPIGDVHLGLFSWPAETGASFDLKIAEEDLYAAADHLIAVAPPAKRALIISLGDFYHSDSKGNATTKGTRVDVDGRWPKVIAAGIRLMRRIIDRALEKHEHVTVICAIGNHDDHSSIFLAIALAQFYEREPRVHIDTSPAKFHWYRFGECLIGVTHSDTVKLDKLGPIMACDRKHDWAETSHRHWFCGHVHHDQLKEYPGVIVETMRTLAAPDAWHSGQGYRSGRDLKLDVFHRKHGRINRHIIGIQQITGGDA